MKETDEVKLTELFLHDEPIHWEENACKYVYHKTVGFPNTIVIPNRIFNLEYTTHAKERAGERISGLMVLPTVARLTSGNIIEIHTDDNQYIKKAIVKIRYDKCKDLILVLEIKYSLKKAAVITVYFNGRNHSFDTLDKTKYNVPERA